MNIPRPIYLDYAATTPVRPEVLEAMLPYFSQSYGNPATLYGLGAAASEAVERAREIVAEALNASPEQIVFTSGGTESDNAALRGAAEANRERGRHILVSPIEHKAVLETCEDLAAQGFEIEFLPTDGDGRIAPEDVAARIRPDTALVSVMFANNEIGTVEPIAEIGAVCRERGALFHTDAAQAFGKVPMDVRAMRIDLLSLSAHKIYGPKGVGALFIRRGTPWNRFLAGGEQERGRRAGTLNVPGIVGLGKAIELIAEEMNAENRRLSALRDRFFERLTRRIPGIRICGSRTERLANNIHFCAEGVEGEPMLLALDAAGICASAGSACATGSVEPSHVLTAIGIDAETARGALRLTMGRETNAEALDAVLETLEVVIRDLRCLSGVGEAGRGENART